jgi:hypothetical protein
VLVLSCVEYSDYTLWTKLVTTACFDGANPLAADKALFDNTFYARVDYNGYFFDALLSKSSPNYRRL